MIETAGKYIAVSGAVHLLDADDTKVTAWAEHHVRKDPDIKWVLGNYVEAERANTNGHIFPLVDLFENGQASVANKPLNMLHQSQYVVGHYAAARLVQPDGTDLTADNLAAWDTGPGKTLAAEDPRPRLEALAAFYHRVFANEYQDVQQAHREGTLFYSMECVPETITCPTSYAGGCEGGCGVKTAAADATTIDQAFTVPFRGLTHDSYCQAMNGRVLPKRLNKARFEAGAIIIPPVRPGWKSADIKTISQLMRDNPTEVDAVYAAVMDQAPHLDPATWEKTMAMIVAHAHGQPLGGVTQ